MRMIIVLALVSSPTLAAAQTSAVPSPDEEVLVEREIDLEASPLPERRNQFVGRMRVAGTVHGYFDTPLYGLEIEASFGVRRLPRRFIVAPTLRYGRAETKLGLDVHRGTLGVLLAWQHDGVMVGLEPAFDLLAIERYTTDRWLIGLGLGADLVIDVDLVRDEADNALFLGLRGGTHYIPEGLHYGGSLGLGARFGGEP
jgi:hypothetical protein